MYTTWTKIWRFSIKRKGIFFSNREREFFFQYRYWGGFNLNHPRWFKFSLNHPKILNFQTFLQFLVQNHKFKPLFELNFGLIIRFKPLFSAKTYLFGLKQKLPPSIFHLFLTYNFDLYFSPISHL